MAYTLTQEQADEVVRILGFDNEADDYECIDGVHAYFLETPEVLLIGPDCAVKLMNAETDADLGQVEALGVDWGVVELRRDGVTKGWLDLCAAPELLTPEQRHIHDLRILDITERTM